MKILFVKPPSNPHILSMTRYEPLEFEYLAASVPGHDADIFDMRIERNLIRKVESFRPDVAGITACSCDVKTVKRIAREIKICDRRIRTVVGGNHATFLPGDFSDLLRYVEDRQLFRPAYPVLTPLPGTALYEETRKDFVITDYDYFDFTHSILPTRLERKQFYFQLARLYGKSYSVKRYFKYLLTRKDGRGPGRPDGISLLKMMLIRTLAVIPYLRMRNAYRSEPAVRSPRPA